MHCTLCCAASELSFKLNKDGSLEPGGGLATSASLGRESEASGPNIMLVRELRPETPTSCLARVSGATACLQWGCVFESPCSCCVMNNSSSAHWQVRC